MPQDDSKIQLSDRQRREALFFDEVANKFIPASKSNNDSSDSLIIDENKAINEYPDYYQYAYKLLGDLKGKSVLDMGCGSGKSSVILAKKGAKVFAFDVSTKYVEVTKLRAQLNNVEDRIICSQMTAEAVQFDSNSFDFVFGVGILHHIDILKGGREILRVLKKGGKAVFLEPIAFSPFLRRIRNLSFIRRIAPNQGETVLVTADERQINEKDLAILKNIFGKVDYKSFQLFSRLERLICGYDRSIGGSNLSNKSMFVKSTIFLLNFIDRILLDNFRFLSKFGRWGVIQLSK